MSDEKATPDHDPAQRPGRPRETVSPASSGSPHATDDAGAQALSEALRSSFTVVKFLVGILVAAFFVSGVFTVKPNQVAIKLRFGKPVGIGADRLLKPGLHWKFPYPIDDVVFVPVGESHAVTSTAGWYYQTAAELAAGSKPQPQGRLRAGVDGYELTGDGDIIHARVTLTYRITNPVSYVFGFGNITNLLQHILDNALVYASARFTADDALYLDRQAFQETVLARVNQSVEALKVGVAVEPREVATQPPVDVAQAFDNVQKAQQEGEQKIFAAEAYARGATNKAIGEASGIVRESMTASNFLVATIASRAEEFNQLLPYYQRAPGLFKQRLLAETVQRVLTNAEYKAYLPELPGGRPWELRLQLSKPPEIRNPEAPKSE
jgi:modulator of FtsH protease HflK